jgi:intein/homing endonuclease
MERDCYIGTTPIPTSFGLSINLKEFKGKQYNVLGWNQQQNGMKPAQQTAFLYKGERECVDIYLEDGRKITCTPEHKMLTSTNVWIKANELKSGESLLKCSVKYPTISINDEIKDCNNWSLKVSNNLTLKTNTEDEYFKSMAFARILGYLLTDGYISNKGISATIYIGHKIDLERLLEDIKLFALVTQTNFKANTRNIYTVKVPHSLIDSILDLDGIMTGAKVSQLSTLPTFILDANCPLPLVREFLGGLFGGDGHTCNISKNTFTYISFSKSKVIGHIDSLKQMMENIKKLLQRFDINGVTIQNPKINSSSKKRLEDDEKNYEIVLHLDMHELIPFYEKIGFRYCCHKNQRMEAAVAYTRLRCGVIRQKKWIINKVDELTDYKQIKKSNSNTNISTGWAIKEAVEKLKEIEPLLHNFAIPSTSDIREYLINKREGGKIPSSKFPTSTEFMKNIDAYCWFKTITNESCYGVAENSEVLPTMNLKVLDIRPGGVHPVYDIQVDKEESFLANGVVAHNCLIAHGAMGFLKERMMDVSDKFTVYICKECGLFSIVNPNGEDGERKCGGCENYSEFMELRIPYACKLLMQELEGMMITPRFNLPKPNL